MKGFLSRADFSRCLLHGRDHRWKSTSRLIVKWWCCTLSCPSLPPSKHKTLYDICTMLDQRRRRWADVVQMSYKCFVFAGRLLLGVDLQRLLANDGWCLTTFAHRWPTVVWPSFVSLVCSYEYSSFDTYGFQKKEKTMKKYAEGIVWLLEFEGNHTIFKSILFWRLGQ